MLSPHVNVTCVQALNQLHMDLLSSLNSRVRYATYCRTPTSILLDLCTMGEELQV